MASPTEQAIREILREAGRPMTTAEIGERLAERMTLKTAKPANTVRNVLSASRTCVSAGRGIYAYLPTAANGAAVRAPIRMVARKGGQCAIGSELAGLLWPGVEAGDQGEKRPPRIALEGGPTVVVEWPRVSSAMPGFTLGPWSVLKLPEPFWDWWEERRQSGTDQLLVRCDDGEAGTYSATTIRSGELDAGAVEAANQGAREAAADALKGTDRGMLYSDLLGRLLARGAYHQPIPPDPLAGVLLLPYPRFLLTGMGRIEYRPDLTPALADLFLDRLLQGWLTAEQEVREALRLPVDSHAGARPLDPLADLGERAPALPFLAPEPATTEVVQAVRLTVALEWMPEVWRTIEIREDQTFADLHDVIQDAFGWDDDHLYSFYLSGRLRDQLTELERPTGFDDFGDRAFFAEFEPMFSDEIAIAELDPTPKQHLLYLFDYGDELLHDITIEASAPANGGTFPRIVETHGEAPPQYPVWEEEDTEPDGDDVGENGDDWIVEFAEATESPGPLDQAFSIVAGFPEADLAAPGQPPAAVPPVGEVPLFRSLFDLLGLERPRFNELARSELPAPDPALRRLPIDLDELVAAFALPGPKPVYLDRQSGSILFVPHVDLPEARLLRETVERDPTRYVQVPDRDLETTPAEMSDFAETVEDARLRQRLLAAARSKAPLVRFMRELSRHEAVAERWNRSVQRRLLARAAAWLADLGIAPEPPAPSSAKPATRGAAGKHKAPTSKRAAKRRKG